MDQLKISTELEAAIKTNDIGAVMRIKGISHKSMVELMRTEFPRFDSPLLSKCRRPDLYGVILHPDGYKILGEFPDRRSENRKLKRRIYGRLTEDEYSKLVNYIAKDGYKNVQEFIRVAVQEYIAVAQNIYGGKNE